MRLAPALFAAGLALGSVATGLVLPALAQMSGHEGHSMPGTAAGPAAEAYAAINARMHEAMAVEFTGNADTDFVRGMIPHHQGAVDMAQVVLEHGTDPEIRALAQGIIGAQETEIAFMQDWLARHP